MVLAEFIHFINGTFLRQSLNDCRKIRPILIIGNVIDNSLLDLNYGLKINSVSNSSKQREQS